MPSVHRKSRRARNRQHQASNPKATIAASNMANRPWRTTGNQVRYTKALKRAAARWVKINRPTAKTSGTAAAPSKAPGSLAAHSLSPKIRNNRAIAQWSRGGLLK